LGSQINKQTNIALVNHCISETASFDIEKWTKGIARKYALVSWENFTQHSSEDVIVVLTTLNFAWRLLQRRWISNKCASEPQQHIVVLIPSGSKSCQLKLYAMHNKSLAEFRVRKKCNYFILAWHRIETDVLFMIVPSPRSDSIHRNNNFVYICLHLQCVWRACMHVCVLPTSMLWVSHSLDWLYQRINWVGLANQQWDNHHACN